MLKMNIKELMIKNDMTVTEISNLTEISRTTINNLVNGKEEPKALQLETLYKLSSVFCVSIDDLFEKYEIEYQIIFNLENVSILNTSETDTVILRTPVNIFYNNKELLQHFLDTKIQVLKNEGENVLINIDFNDSDLKWHGLKPVLSDLDSLKHNDLKEKLEHFSSLIIKEEKLGRILSVYPEKKLVKQLEEIFEITEVFSTVFDIKNKKIKLIY